MILQAFSKDFVKDTLSPVPFISGLLNKHLGFLEQVRPCTIPLHVLLVVQNQILVSKISFNFLHTCFGFIKDVKDLMKI